MKSKTNRFVLVNIFCLLVFVASLFGLFDWALAFVVLIVGVSLSTFFGALSYSKKFVEGMVCRSVFAVGILSTGYAFFKLGEYLNREVYDGLITLTVLAYVVLATLLLHYLGKKV